MKSVLSIFLLVSFVSCSQQTFKYVVDNREKSYTYKYIVPIGFTFYGWSGGYEDEKQYWYSDSSVFYITKAKGLTLINSENVRAIPGAYSKLLLADTISLQGIDSKNLHWKHIKLEGFSYGFSNVSKDDLEKFNKIISSITHNK